MGKLVTWCFVFGSLLLTGCVEPPSSPAQAAARKAAAAELVARRCGFMMGGFSDGQQLRQVANEQIVLARRLGANDAMISQARVDVDTAFSTASAFTSPREACGSLMGELAWAT